MFLDRINKINRIKNFRMENRRYRSFWRRLRRGVWGATPVFLLPLLSYMLKTNMQIQKISFPSCLSCPTC